MKEIKKLIEFCKSVQDDFGKEAEGPSLGELCSAAEKEVASMENEKNHLIECQLVTLDLEDFTATFDVPKEIMGKGIHAGKANIDFRGVQSNIREE